MVKVVLDSNIIIEKDWLLDSPDLELLSLAIHGEHVILVVPELVIQEVVNKYRTKLEARLDKATSSLRNLHELTFFSEPFPTPKLNIEDEVGQYERLLRERLNELGAETPTYDDIPHALLVEKAIKRTKPFKDMDRGYRDGLLWETVLSEVASIDYQTIFVTDNKNDFCAPGSNTELHSDLLQEIIDAKLPEDSIILFPRLSSVIDNTVKPFLADRKRKLENFPFDDWLEAELDNIITQLTSKIDCSGFSPFPSELFESSYIESLGLVTSTADDTYEFDEEQLYIEISAELEASFILTVYYADFYTYSERWNLYPLESSSDDKLVETCLTLLLPTRFTLILNKATGNVIEFELELPEFYGWCPHCGAPIISDTAEQCSECGKDLF